MYGTKCIQSDNLPLQPEIPEDTTLRRMSSVGARGGHHLEEMDSWGRYAQGSRHTTFSQVHNVLFRTDLLNLHIYSYTYLFLQFIS